MRRAHNFVLASCVFQMLGLRVFHDASFVSTVAGYFQALQRVLETRVPPPDGPDSAHSALADSLLAFLTLPLLRPGGDRSVSSTSAISNEQVYSTNWTFNYCCVNEICTKHVCKPNCIYFRYLERFVSEVLCQTLTPHTAHLLLPHLSRSPLPLPTLITTVHTSLIANSLPPSLSLLFSILQLTQGKLGGSYVSSLTFTFLFQEVHVLNDFV